MLLVRYLFGVILGRRHSAAASFPGTIATHMKPRRNATSNLRRERIQASPRFNGRIFQNTFPVSSGLKPGVERPTMRDFLCPGEDRVPSGPLPLVDPIPVWTSAPASGLRV